MVYPVSFAGQFIADEELSSNCFTAWTYFKHRYFGDEVKSWNDRPSDISKDRWRLLQEIYDDPRDIDLFTGKIKS